MILLVFSEIDYSFKVRPLYFISFESKVYITYLNIVCYGVLSFVLDLTAVHQNGLSMNQMLMGLSPNVLPGPKEGDLAGHDMGHESKRMHVEKGNM